MSGEKGRQPSGGPRRGGDGRQCDRPPTAGRERQGFVAGENRAHSSFPVPRHADGLYWSHGLLRMVALLPNEFKIPMFHVDSDIHVKTCLYEYIVTRARVEQWK